MTPIKIPKKLIEVALPLDAINVAAAREKSIRHGHPSTLHLWWARRPLAAARAVIFAQMVNDPGYQQGGGFKYGVNKEKAAIERERLFKIIEDLVQWENTNNEEVLARARAEIERSWRETCELNRSYVAKHPQAAELFNPDKLPAFHDPFAGGGALPLEAQRLGLESYASDLNPVAVTINKAMIEIPPKFAGRAPVGPAPQTKGKKSAELFAKPWQGAQGLAEDVRRYGAWMRSEAEKRIGHLYPNLEITPEMAVDREDLKPLVGQKLTVIAWLWARTVNSPNPAFSHAQVPLASTFVLSSKAGKEAYVEPVVDGDRYRFTVKMGTPPETLHAGTTAGKRAAFICLLSKSPIDYNHIRVEGKAGRMGQRLMAIVAEGVRGRVYLEPTAEQIAIAESAQPDWSPEMELPNNPRDFKTPNYGLSKFGDLFTPRQLVALTTFSDLVQEAIEKCRQDALGTRAFGPPSPDTPPKGWYSRGYHPHFDAPGLIQSITFRLHDSVPAELIARWRQELALMAGDEERAGGPRTEFRERIARYEDAGYGACHLRDPRIAELVENALLHFDGERYRLLEWCVMPNHVHVLIETRPGFHLADIVRSWKTFTAREANRLLGSSGSFWMPDYFDRYIRDEAHLAAVVRYVRENPVKAGLCAAVGEWRWGSAWEGRAGGPRTQEDDRPLDQGGTGATAYAQAVGVYLGFALNKLADRGSSICTWFTERDSTRNTFARQSIPMTWDFAELNTLLSGTGSFSGAAEWTAESIEGVAVARASGRSLAAQSDAQTQTISQNKVVSTDPPYYDNIGYADLSDFFYVWLRKSLKPIFPGLYATLAVPKAEELVATPYRHGSKEKAEAFFLDGMTRAIHNLAEQAHPAFPVTIYYAFKQAETKGETGTSSTGWETFLEAVLTAGFAITGTWPMRTELGNRMIGSGTNALASSIVLVCRKRATDAPTVSRREFLRELNAVLPDALDEMTRGGVNSPVAPVDLSQAIIGPGMAIFSQYAAVLEADGKPMSVRTALQLINRFFAEDDFDHDTQFCLHWFETQGWAEGKYGEADVLARAKGTSVGGLQEAGVIDSGAGKLRLLRWADLPADWSPEADTRTPVWEALHQLIRALNQQGESAAGALRALAYRLYTLCERKGWAEEARAYNELVTAWSGIEQAAGDAGLVGSQAQLDI